jgi:hypothetical protein
LYNGDKVNDYRLEGGGGMLDEEMVRGGYANLRVQVLGAGLIIENVSDTV